MKVDRFIPSPGHRLQPYIRSIWRVRADGEYSQETILPQGNVDILFNMGGVIGLAREARIDDLHLNDMSYLAGPQTRSVRTHPRGHVHLLGVSMKIEGCAALLPLPTNEITNITIDGDRVFRDLDEMSDRLYSAPDFVGQCRLLTEWLERRIVHDRQTDMILHACRTIGHAPFDSTIDRVATTLDLSSRHLRRLFLERLGIGPSHYLRLSRFTTAMRLMATSEATLTEIAHAAGYHDQAHFCRDFKAIGDMTPSDYRRRVGLVPGHLFAK